MFFKIKKSDKNSKNVFEVLDDKFKSKPAESNPVIQSNNSNILVKLINSFKQPSFKKPSYEKAHNLKMEKSAPENKLVETKSKFLNMFNKFSLKKKSDFHPFFSRNKFPLHSFQTITLKELEKKTTWKERTDVKYITHVSTLDSLHEILSKEYLILEDEGKRSIQYKTEYWDTSRHDMFYQHQLDHPYRYKIRKRQYDNQNDYWMEVKQKIYGKTTKYRLLNPSPNETEKFISTNSPFKQCDLKSTIFIYYERMTFVHKNLPIKITIDKNMKVGNNHRSIPFDNVSIIEIKTENNDFTSNIVDIIESQGIKPCNISKYCVGMAKMYPEMKKNIVKHKSALLELKKIIKNW